MAKQDTKKISAKKEEDISKWYTDVIQKADLADYSEVSGCMVFKPNSYSMWELIQQETDKEFKKIGIKNAYFPLLIPEKFLQKEATHVEGFAPEVAWVTEAGNSKLSERLAIRPTSETIMYDHYSRWIKSWRDLPLRLNQWNNVIRWEFKHPVAFLRTREFLWNEGHTAFANKKEAEAERDQILNIYEKVLKELCCTYASAGFKSESEKFAGAEYTCSLESFLPSGKAIQGPDFHHDGQNFAKAFNIKFLNKEGKTELAYQNTFAITTRVLGIMIMIHGDNKGLVTPPKLAPIQAVIVPIFKEDTKDKVIAEARKLEKTLKKIRTFTDDSEEYTPGWKFNEYELQGVPLRIEIGPKDIDNNQAVIAIRDTGEKKTVKLDKVAETVEEELKVMSERLYDNSKKMFKDSIVEVDNFKDLSKVIDQKKMAFAPFCNTSECEDSIKDKTGGATTRNIPFEHKKSYGKCVHCDKEATCKIYIAKAY